MQAKPCQRNKQASHHRISLVLGATLPSNRRKRKNEDNEIMIDKLTYINSQDLLADASAIIETAKNIACRSINITLVQRNWLLGKRIVEEQLGDQTREELYGQKIVENLAKELTEQYGSGFDRSNLYLYIRFYESFPNIVDAARQQSPNMAYDIIRNNIYTENLKQIGIKIIPHEQKKDCQN